MTRHVGRAQIEDRLGQARRMHGDHQISSNQPHVSLNLDLQNTRRAIVTLLPSLMRNHGSFDGHDAIHCQTKDHIPDDVEVR